MGQSWAVPETDGRIVGIAMVFSNTISLCSAWRWDEVRLGSVDLWRDPGCGEWVPMVGSTYLSDDESEGRFSKFAPNQYSKYKRGHKEVKFLSFLLVIPCGYHFPFTVYLLMGQENPDLVAPLSHAVSQTLDVQGGLQTWPNGGLSQWHLACRAYFAPITY